MTFLRCCVIPQILGLLKNCWLVSELQESDYLCLLSAGRTSILHTAFLQLTSRDGHSLNYLPALGLRKSPERIKHCQAQWPST